MERHSVWNKSGISWIRKGKYKAMLSKLIELMIFIILAACQTRNIIFYFPLKLNFIELYVHY